MAAQMGKQEEEAKEAIAKWQESCNALEEQSENLVQQLEASHDKEHRLGAQLQDTQKELEEAKTRLREDEESLAKWQGEHFLWRVSGNIRSGRILTCLFGLERVSELEEVVKDLQTKLDEQEKDATEAIDKWQESCNALEDQNSQLQQKLSESGEQAGELQAKLTSSQRALEDAKSKMKDDELALAKGHGKPNFAWKLCLFIAA